MNYDVLFINMEGVAAVTLNPVQREEGIGAFDYKVNTDLLDTVKSYQPKRVVIVAHYNGPGLNYKRAMLDFMVEVYKDFFKEGNIGVSSIYCTSYDRLGNYLKTFTVNNGFDISRCLVIYNSGYSEGSNSGILVKAARSVGFDCIDTIEFQDLFIRNALPFDIEKAKSGAHVITRNGHDVRIICFDKKDNLKPIVALIKGTDGFEELAYYNKFGKLDNMYYSRFDLLIKNDENDEKL